MDGERNPWARARRRALVRGGLAAVVSTSIALVFHLMAGGAMPALPGLAVPLLLALSVCVLLAGVRVPWVRLLLSVGASQLLFHHLFMLGAGGDAAAHAHHAMSTPAAQPYASTWMVLAHLAAAVLTALALRHGELLVTRLGAALRNLTWHFLHPVLALPVRPTAPATVPVDERARVPASLARVNTSVVRRGPPLCLATPLS